LKVTKERSTYGYKRTTALVNRERRAEGLKNWSRHRIFRVMKMNKLMLPKTGTRKERPHLGQVITINSNVRFCSDIFEIKAWDGTKVRVAFSLDCHDREILAFVGLTRPVNHFDVIELIDRTVTSRFGEFIQKLPRPIEFLSDNGPQYTAHETRDYLKEWGFEPKNTPAYSPESNGMAEAFVKLFKKDYVYSNELWTAESVLRRLPEWFDDYNKNHPHSGLQMRSPLEYRKATSVSV
jgi:putative transposase